MPSIFRSKSTKRQRSTKLALLVYDRKCIWTACGSGDLQSIGKFVFWSCFQKNLIKNKNCATSFCHLGGNIPFRLFAHDSLYMYVHNVAVSAVMLARHILLWNLAWVLAGISKKLTGVPSISHLGARLRQLQSRYVLHAQLPCCVPVGSFPHVCKLQKSSIEESLQPSSSCRSCWLDKIESISVSPYWKLYSMIVVASPEKKFTFLFPHFPSVERRQFT